MHRNSNPIGQYARRSDTTFSPNRNNADNTKDETSFNSLRTSYRKKESDLNRYIKICLTAFVILFIIYIWFLFNPSYSSTTYHNATSSSHHHHHRRPDSRHTSASDDERGLSNVAAELVKLANLHEFKNIADKRQFIEDEFNKRLSKYNGSVETLQPFYAQNKNVLNPDSKEFAELYRAFIDKYNTFLKASEESKLNYQKMKEMGDKYRELEAELQREKNTIFDLLHEEDHLRGDKVKIDEEIQKLTDQIDRENTNYTLSETELSAEARVIEESRRRLKRLDCESVFEKINKYQREKQKLEHALKISRTRLIAIVSDMQYLLARLAELERELKQKQNLQELTAISLKSSDKLAQIVLELQESENEKSARIRAQITETLNYLKAKFDFLSRIGGISEIGEEEYNKEKAFYINATYILKQHVRLLVRMKRLHANETKLVLEGLNIHGNPKYLREKLTSLEHEINQRKKDIQELRDKLEKESRVEIEINTSTVESEKIIQGLIDTMDRNSHDNKDCLEKAQAWSKELADFEIKQRAIRDAHESTINQLSGNLKPLQTKSRADDAKIHSNQHIIDGLQRSLDDIVKKLAYNQHKLNSQKDEFIKRDSLAQITYDELQIYKQKMIDYLTKIDSIPQVQDQSRGEMRDWSNSQKDTHHQNSNYQDRNVEYYQHPDSSNHYDGRTSNNVDRNHAHDPAHDHVHNYVHDHVHNHGDSHVHVHSHTHDHVHNNDLSRGDSLDHTHNHGHGHHRYVVTETVHIHEDVRVKDD